MDTVLTIEGEEAARLAQQLAELTGESVGAVVVRALVEQVERERRKRAAHDLARELVEIGRRCAAQLDPPFNSADHADLYGPDGLPA